jgi:lytic cellulose monooxygenase (C1-hydroxylating)
MMLSIFFLITAYLGCNLADAHAYIQQVTSDDQLYSGFRPDEPFYVYPKPVVTWSFKAPDRGFVNDYNHPDIICHRSAAPAPSYVQVANGGTLRLSWSDWPPHQGPVITYLAACNGPCERTDKSTLNFFKIEELGLLDPAGGARGTGYWALDSLIANNNTWSITIPANLSPGPYVLRHEAINLDHPIDKAQHYPQCVNIEVIGDGTQVPTYGVAGTKLYRADDPGLLFDIYHINGRPYPIPGPSLSPPLKRMLGGSVKRDWFDFWTRFAKYIKQHSNPTSFDVTNSSSLGNNTVI